MAVKHGGTGTDTMNEITKSRSPIGDLLFVVFRGQKDNSTFMSKKHCFNLRFLTNVNIDLQAHIMHQNFSL